METKVRGAMRPSSANRTPSFIFIGLLVVIAILGFNYWNVTSKNSTLSRKLTDMSDRLRQTSFDKSSSDARFEEVSQRLAEIEKEVTRQKQTVSQKGDEINGMTSQLNDARQQLDTAVDEQTKCKLDLDASFTKQIQFENSEAALRAERDEKSQQFADCESSKSQASDANKEECTQVGDAVRVQLLTSIQKLFGDESLRILNQNGVNVADLTEGLVPQGQFNIVVPGQEAAAPQQVQQPDAPAPVADAPAAEVPAVEAPVADAPVPAAEAPAGDAQPLDQQQVPNPEQRAPEGVIVGEGQPGVEGLQQREVVGAEPVALQDAAALAPPPAGQDVVAPEGAQQVAEMNQGVAPPAEMNQGVMVDPQEQQRRRGPTGALEAPQVEVAEPIREAEDEEEEEEEKKR